MDKCLKIKITGNLCNSEFTDSELALTAKHLAIKNKLIAEQKAIVDAATVA